MSSPILEVRDLDVSYGKVQVLFGLNLSIDEGELVALLGTNGAGKSTLFRAITGLNAPQHGEIRFKDEDLRGVDTDEIARRGVVMMPGGRSVFPSLTVRENLTMAGWLKRHDRQAEAEAVERVLTLLPRLGERIEQPAGNLSGGEQQMLAVAQALIPDPQLLLIDELSLGLAPTIVGQLVDVVHAVHATGLTIVVVEQSVNVALKLAERAVFMEKGEFRFTGPTKELLERPDILRSVFIDGAAASGGRQSRRAAARVNATTAGEMADEAPVLECRSVIKRYGGITAIDSADVIVRPGEIVGLIGQNGAGKTTLLDCVSGFVTPDSGRIVLNGEDITAASPDHRAMRGLGRTFQEARLFPTLTVAETLAVARERHLASRSMVADAFAQPITAEVADDVGAIVDELIELLNLGAFRSKLNSELSTGSRRIVELACVLASRPQVVALDEPSGGVAQRETEALGPLLQQVQAETGASMLVIEHDMPLLTRICNRLYALESGAVIAEGTPDEVLNHPRVIESYLGQDASVINRSGSLGSRRRAPRRTRA